MKLDKMQFARLVAYIAGIIQRGSIDATDLTVIDELIVDVPEQTEKVYPANYQVERLMALMAHGTDKIEAIKQHRAITGMELKDSKDVIEKYWPDGSKKMFSIADLRSKLNSETWNVSDYSVMERFIQSLYHDPR